MVNEMYNVILNIGLLCLPVILLYKFNTSKNIFKKFIKNEDEDCNCGDCNCLNCNYDSDSDDVSDDVSSDDGNDGNDNVSDCSNVTNNTSNLNEVCSDDIVMEPVLQEPDSCTSQEISDEIANQFAEEFLNHLELRNESQSQFEIDKKIKAILDDF
jgi:hypothetical protein